MSSKCYLHLNNLDKASQIVDYLSNSNYPSKELLLIKQKIGDFPSICVNSFIGI